MCRHTVLLYECYRHCLCLLAAGLLLDHFGRPASLVQA